MGNGVFMLVARNLGSYVLLCYFQTKSISCPAELILFFAYQFSHFPF